MTTVVVTGSTGTTGRHLVPLLRSDGHTVKACARHPEKNGVYFDWTKSETFDVLDKADAVYLVAPSGVSEPLPVMLPFLRHAVRHPSTRLVLLSAAALECGGPMMGKVHAWLLENALDWHVLRPGWFMQNFSEGRYRASVHTDGAIYSATGSGSVGFIDAADIAGCAAVLLTGPAQTPTDWVITGPEALSYDEVASTLTKVADRPVKHIRASRVAMIERYQRQGFELTYAKTLAALEDAISCGAEDGTTTHVEELLGRPPRAFGQFAAANASAWGAA